MEASSSQPQLSDLNQTASSFLANLPSRGLFTSAAFSPNQVISDFQINIFFILLWCRQNVGSDDNYLKYFALNRRLTEPETSAKSSLVSCF